jgi:XTP/dITP diphosphohydrolase
MPHPAPALLIATFNPGKIQELTEALKPLNFRLVTLADLPGHCSAPFETGANFQENAILKARYYAGFAGIPALADDSGLMVDALGGEPGVYSARYGGEGLSDMARNLFLLEKMAGIKDRRARFVATLALASPEGTKTRFWEGTLLGEIALSPVGENGFGYDPVFLDPKSGLTLAQMTLAEKSRISHRARAVEKLRADPPDLVG